MMRAKEIKVITHLDQDLILSTTSSTAGPAVWQSAQG